MIVLGLTGSIGMGKSTTAAMFRAFGVPVFDADRCVHRVYAGEPPAAVAARFPEAVVDGKIDRGRLGSQVLDDREAMAALEEMIHPIVESERNKFICDQKKGGARIVVLDVPLLFETDTWRRVDAIIVVTAPKEVQRERVLSRDLMDEDKFFNILKRQIPDTKKRKSAQFIVKTEFGFESVRRQIRNVIAALAQIDK
ncbi:dephospho-CoA kinase [Rhodoblastus sp.]|uniref:dephospho-CoA kinase n=1 Tax=Rhodoblastus sp. TaxID=1962975 RepID=UPI0026080707|nr:dephospho-CoA kinase [Rhodoblastus sp.]